ncbi:MAG: NERD domain-containing protein [Bacilli bacterium]|nr:NERD domain-containing protein [Bacilli bacterium]
MIFSGLNTFQIIYIITVSLIVLVALFCVIYFPLRRRYIKKQYVEYYYREIYKIAMANDYYLINEFSFKIDDNSLLKIDHILFGDKYVYIINDCYYEGDIVGKILDKSLVCLSKKGKKFYIDNPILKNRFLLTRLCMVTNLDPSIMIGITVVNDDCNCEINSDSKQFYAISRNKLASLIKAIESRPISNLNAKSLDKLVQSINKMNRKKKTK